MAAGEVVDRLVALDRQLDLDRDHPFSAGGIAVDEVCVSHSPSGSAARRWRTARST